MVEAIAMTIDEALKDIEIAFLQVEFTLKLLTFCECGKIDPGEFDTDHQVRLEAGDLHFPTGHFSDSNSIINAASVCVSLAFGASALALDKAFEVKGIKSNPDASDNIGRLRTVVYMVRCAYAHGIADPRWEVNEKHRRTLVVALDGPSISLDLRALNGQGFQFEQLGGHRNWFLIRDAAVRALMGK